MIYQLTHAMGFAHKLIEGGASYNTLEKALADPRTNIPSALQQTIKTLFSPENLGGYYFAIIQPQPQHSSPYH